MLETVKLVCAELWPKFDIKSSHSNMNYVVDVLLPEVRPLIMHHVCRLNLRCVDVNIFSANMQPKTCIHACMQVIVTLVYICHKNFFLFHFCVQACVLFIEKEKKCRRNKAEEIYNKARGK